MAPQELRPLSHLSNPLANAEQLASSGSQLDGIPSDLEASIIFAGAKLTQAAGILLRLPQDVIAGAIAIFQRFFVGAEGGSLREHGARVSFHSWQLKYSTHEMTGHFSGSDLSHGQDVCFTKVTAKRAQCLLIPVIVALNLLNDSGDAGESTI